jgi:hypothetical protein
MAPDTSTEQRASPRVPVALELHLVRKVGNEVVCRTCDLGVGGACVVTRRPLRVDEELHFDLELPTDGRHVNGVARVLRQQRHDTYALRFEQVPDTVADALGAFVHAHAG